MLFDRFLGKSGHQPAIAGQSRLVSTQQSKPTLAFVLALQLTAAGLKIGRAIRGVTPALSACRRPLHRRLVESEKPTASPQRSPETQIDYRPVALVAGRRMLLHRSQLAVTHTPARRHI
jgi:hypothetical protein